MRQTGKKTPDVFCAINQRARRGQEPLHHRHDERRGLAGARFRAGDEVVSGEGQRNDGALNRTRLAEAEVADAFQQSRVKIERGECDRRRVARRRLEGRRARDRRA